MEPQLRPLASSLQTSLCIRRIMNHNVQQHRAPRQLKLRKLQLFADQPVHSHVLLIYVKAVGAA